MDQASAVEAQTRNTKPHHHHLTEHFKSRFLNGSDLEWLVQKISIDSSSPVPVSTVVYLPQVSFNRTLSIYIAMVPTI